jgi:hypothetical protein
MSVKNIKFNNNTIPIREFHLDSMEENPTIAMIAKRGSGKTWICRSLLKHYENIPGGMIISKTEEADTFYSDFFPEIFIHKEYTSEAIESLFYRQNEMKKKKRAKREEGKKIDSRAFLLMDDCLADSNEWKKDQSMLDLFYNGRHSDITFILTMQYPLGIGPSLRSNIDYIFLLATDFVKIQKIIYENYAGMFPTFKSFKEVYSQITENYGAMVIVNRGHPSRDICDKIFWFRSEKETFDKEIGCSQFRDFNKKNYDKNYSDNIGNYKSYLENKKSNIVVELK